MSDSEEEFASADEGEAGATGHQAIASSRKHPTSEVSKTTEKASPEKTTEKAQSKKKGKAGGKGKPGPKDGGKAAEGDGGRLDSAAKQSVEGKGGKKGKQKGGRGAKSGAQKETSIKTETVPGKVDETGDSKSVPEPASETVPASVKGKTADTKPVSESVVESAPKVVDEKIESKPVCAAADKSVTEESMANTGDTSAPAIDSKEKTMTEERAGDKSEVTDNKTDTLIAGVSDDQGKKPDTAKTSESATTEAGGAAAGLLKSPSSQSISRPEPDHTQQQENVLEKLSGETKSKGSGWGWGWGSSLLDVASSSVSTFTSQVGEGLSTMLETVESTLNVPSPEDMVQKQSDMEQSKTDSSESTEPPVSDKTSNDTDQSNESQNKQSGEKESLPGDAEEQSGGEKMESETQSAEDGKQATDAENQSAEEGKQATDAENQSGGGWFSSWGVSNITKMVESTGKNLVTGSIDVLETLGKKTFDVINDTDPGLKKTRGLLRDRGNKPNLSALLRDAKEQGEVRAQQEQESEEARKAHFGSLFDDFQGLAHLEALEILSNQSEKRVTTLLGALPPDAIATLKPQLLEIKGNFEMGEDEDEEAADDHDFNKLVTDLLAELDVGTSPDKLTQTHEGIRTKLMKHSEISDKEEPSETDGEEMNDPKVVHQVAIQSLAELTSRSIEQFHKCGEMILLHVAHQSDFVSSSHTLLTLTKVLCAEVGILSSKFTECLNKSAGDDGASSVNPLVTNVYLEASNSSSYIQDGFQLLLPVLQQAAIEKSQESSS